MIQQPLKQGNTVPMTRDALRCGYAISLAAQNGNVTDLNQIVILA